MWPNLSCERQFSLRFSIARVNYWRLKFEPTAKISSLQDFLKKAEWMTCQLDFQFYWSMTDAGKTKTTWIFKSQFFLPKALPHCISVTSWIKNNNNYLLCLLFLTLLFNFTISCFLFFSFYCLVAGRKSYQKVIKSPIYNLYSCRSK